MSEKEQSAITQIRLLAMTLKFAYEDAENAKNAYDLAIVQSNSMPDWVHTKNALIIALSEIDDISRRICQQALKLVEDAACATQG